MDKDLKRKLFTEILNHLPFTDKRTLELILNELLAVDDIKEEEQIKLLEEQKAKEIAELESKKAEAEKVIKDVNAKLSTLTINVK
jgi:hypothetical protein